MITLDMIPVVTFFLANANVSALRIVLKETANESLAFSLHQCYNSQVDIQEERKGTR